MTDTAQSNDEIWSKKRNKSDSQIPVLSPTHFRRAGSLKLRSDSRSARKTEPPVTSTPQMRRHRSLQTLSPLLGRRADEHRDDDLDSERSLDSSCTSLCGHSPFAHNGTTYSARNKYVFHCTTNTGSDEYLTPTQRANRTIKRLRQMLAEAQSELIEKDSEISQLTKEIVELRLLKMDDGEAAEESTGPPITQCPRSMSVLHEEHDGSSMSVLHEELDSGAVDGVRFGEQCTPTTNQADNRGVSPQHTRHSPSLADSGNFEDINCSFVHSLEKELEKLRQSYEDMREKHNEKVEQLLKIIADSNDKYYDLKPKYDDSKLKIKELEKQIESLKNTIANQEEVQKTLYMQIVSKPTFGEDDQRKDNDIQQKMPSPSHPVEESEIFTDTAEPVTNLKKKLSATKKELESVKDKECNNDALLSAGEAISLWILGTRKAMYKALLEASRIKTTNDAETTLRFLKSAIFYYLTDTTNCKDHLTAIESILGYSEEEKTKIEKVQAWKY